MKSLIIPVLTAPWIPSESELPNVLNTSVIIRNGAEWTTWEEPAFHGAPQSFHTSCERLLHTFSGRASGVLMLGTTGEWPAMWPLQSLVAFSAMQQACPPDITLYAGVLVGDAMVADQVRSAQSLGINDIVLWLNHTWNNIARFQAAIWALGVAWRLLLYNLPTFRPADKKFILSCLEDPRVLGFKDSSGDPAFFSWLLSLKKERPYLKIFHGSEPAYGDLPDEELRNVDGLVSGNANLHPALLHEYTKNPRNAAVARGRSDLHTSIVGSSRSSHNNPVVSIEEHILQLKRKLVRLCVSPHDQQRKIFSHGQDVLLSHPRGSLFRTYRSDKA